MKHPSAFKALALVLGLLFSGQATGEVPVGKKKAPRVSGHRDLMPTLPHAFSFKRQDAPKMVPMSDSKPIVNREVMGYLPYWIDDYEPQWELLTILAWFGVDMSPKGDIDNLHGWGNEATEELVAAAKAHGVRVIVTVTLFDDDGIATLLGDPEYRQNAIASCLEMIAVHEVDGINIDFEFVPAQSKENFVTFMKDLKVAVKNVQPNGWDGHVSLAGPAVDWDGAYDYDQLLIHSDGIMVMAYGYHWAGGDPGPVSPLYGKGIWGEGSKSVAWTIDDYLKWGGEENRHKVFIGLPWYGREWPVATEEVPGIALASGDAITYSKAGPEALEAGKKWDDDSQTPYYHTFRNGQLTQVWYDDGKSFGEKLAYIVEKDLGGLGIWALGYEGSLSHYWDGIKTHFAAGGGPGDDASDASSSADAADGDVSSSTDAGPDPDISDEDAETEADAAKDPDVQSDGGSDSSEPTADTSALASDPQSSSVSTETESGGCVSASPPAPWVLLWFVACFAVWRRRYQKTRMTVVP